MVRQEQRLAVVAHPHLVGIVLAAQLGRGEAVADLDALDRVDAHQRRGELGVELGVDRRAEARRHALGDDLDHRADRGAGLAHLVEIALVEFRLNRVGAEERIVADLVPVPARAIDFVRAHLHQRAAHAHARHDLSRDGAGGDAHRRLARRGSAAAAIIVDAVFDVVGVAGVAGPVLVLDVGIVLRALVDVLDQERDRRAGRHLAAVVIGEDAGQDLHRVRLLALRGEARLAGPALVEIALDVGGLERDQRRAAVDHAADRRPVAFAEAGEPEQMAEGVEGHGCFSLRAKVVARALPAVKSTARSGFRRCQTFNRDADVRPPPRRRPETARG